MVKAKKKKKNENKYLIKFDIDNQKKKLNPS